MDYSHKHIEIHVKLTLDEIDDLYNCISTKQIVSKERKEYFASCLENIVKEYRQSIDLGLRSYDATDQEAQLELSKAAHEFRFGVDTLETERKINV